MLVMIMHNGLGVGSWNFEVSLSSYSTAVLVFVHLAKWCTSQTTSL